MWNIEATIDGAFEGGKDLGSGGRAGQTNVQHATERTGSVINRLDEEVLASHLRHALVGGVKTELLQVLKENCIFRSLWCRK